VQNNDINLDKNTLLSTNQYEMRPLEN
jgi:hypothetical protein